MCSTNTLWASNCLACSTKWILSRHVADPSLYGPILGLWGGAWGRSWLFLNCRHLFSSDYILRNGGGCRQWESVFGNTALIHLYRALSRPFWQSLSFDPRCSLRYASADYYIRSYFSGQNSDQSSEAIEVIKSPIEVWSDWLSYPD